MPLFPGPWLVQSKSPNFTSQLQLPLEHDQMVCTQLANVKYVRVAQASSHQTYPRICICGNMFIIYSVCGRLGTTLVLNSQHQSYLLTLERFQSKTLASVKYDTAKRKSKLTTASLTCQIVTCFVLEVSGVIPTISSDTTRNTEHRAC